MEQKQNYSRPTNQSESEDIRSGLRPETIAKAFNDNLAYLCARFPEVATRNDRYLALAYTVRDRLLHRWTNTAQYLLSNAQPIGVLPLSRIFNGPPIGQQSDQPGHF